MDKQSKDENIAADDKYTQKSTQANIRDPATDFHESIKPI